MPNPRAAGVVPTADDIRRAYYETAPYSAWITEIQLDPLALIVMDDDTGQLTRIPVITAPGGGITFGPAEPVLVSYQPGTAPVPAGPAAAAAAFPAGRRVAAAWPDRKASRAGADTPATATAADRARVIAAAVACGKIPAGKAARWRAALDADPASAAGLLARMYPLGHPIGAPGAAEAGKADDHTWSQLFSHVKQPPARDADETRKVTPMSEAEFRRLYPEPGSYDPAAFETPPMPGLSGYVPSAPLKAPPEGPPPQLDQAAAARRGGVAASPDPAAPGGTGGLGIVEHGEVSAWHTHAHAHPGSDLNGHSHQHVHQAGSAGSHAIGPGHSHDAPAEFTPDLAGRGGPGARPFTIRVAAGAAARPAGPGKARWSAGPPGRRTAGPGP